MAETELLQQSFPVSGQARLKVSNVRGAVRLTAAETGEIQVRALKYLDDADGANTQVSLSQEADGRVVVKVENAGAPWKWFNRSNPCRVEIEVSLPADTLVEASVVSAVLAATGLQADASFSSVSGEMQLEALQGKLRLTTVSGDVHGRGLTGSLHLNTISGDVTLADANLESLNFTSVSGNLKLYSRLGEGPYRLQSTSGDVDWLLSEAAACQVQMHAVSGKLTVDMPGQPTFSGRGASLRLGQGGPLVQFNTVSGDLQLHTAQVTEPA